MRKFMIYFLVAAMILLPGCGNSKKDKRVDEAIEALSDKWEEIFDDLEISGQKDSERYLKIIQTTLFEIEEGAEGDFENVDYIVRFELLSTYLGGDIPENVSQYNCVVVDRDGNAIVTNDLLRIYRTRNYSSDFSGIVSDVIKFDEAYNQELKLD